MSENSIKFAVFADFHYKQGMYAVTVSDLDKIIERAKKNNVDFILHAGDFCNDYIGSPEVVDKYINCEIPVYGVYGNHELESKYNSMKLVTPLLTNKADSVIWGTADGKIADGDIGYYYFDKGNFRIVCTDTNYSYSEQANEWQHNTTCSYGPPSGNILYNSLAPKQLRWLESVLTDAAEKGKKCIVLGHAAFLAEWGGSSDEAKAVRAIYDKVNSKSKNTVLMSVNGHHHTNRNAIYNGVLYWDVNTAINGCWQGKAEPHYNDEHTFEYIKYNEAGEVESRNTAPLKEVWMSGNTWYFKEPLSAIVTVSVDGNIKIEGMKTEWVYGVIPQGVANFVTPEISDVTVKL